MIDDHFDDLAKHTCTRRAARRRYAGPANALAKTERDHTCRCCAPRNTATLPPAQTWARLLDDGIYLCSIATMYRP